MRDDTISAVNGLQIACLAVLTSTTVAIAVFFGVRRKFGSVSGARGHAPVHTQAAAEFVRPSRPVGTAHHFSEDLTVPPLTQTGAEIAEQDANEGRSLEGV